MIVSWPSAVDPCDPFPEPLRDDPAPVDGRTSLKPLRVALADLWAGRAEEADVVSLFRARGLDRPFRARERPLPVGPRIPSEAELVEIATDADPAAGSIGADLVLGPVADGPVDRRTLQVAVALSAFFRGDGVVGAPHRRWHRIHPAPSVSDRAAVGAVAHAPLAPWRILRLAPHHVEVQDVIGLSSVAIPQGPVVLRGVGQPFGPPTVGGLLVSRIARGAQGWVATCPIAMPGDLPPAIPRWLRWLGWADRLDRKGRISLVGVLARQGHQLTRRLLELRWAA